MDAGVRYIIPEDQARTAVEYHFVTDEQMHIFERQGKVVELRTYNTVHRA